MCQSAVLAPPGLPFTPLQVLSAQEADCTTSSMGLLDLRCPGISQLEAQRADAWGGGGRTVMSGRLFPWLSPQVPAGQWHSLTEGHSPSHNGPHFSFWVLITSPSPHSLRQEVVRGHCSVLCNFSTYCLNLRQ